MGRRKIEIQPISDERNRTITFVKRKAGLFKKAHELAILCQVDLAVIILNNNNKNYYEFSSCNIDELLTNYKKSNNIYESKDPSSFGAPYDSSKNKHKRHSSNNSFSNTDSIADDDSDSEQENDHKRHKRDPSEISAVGKTHLSKVQSVSNFNGQNLFDAKTLNNNHLKSASYSNGFNYTNGVNKQSQVNNNDYIRPFVPTQLQHALQTLQSLQSSQYGGNVYQKMPFATTKISHFDEPHDTTDFNNNSLGKAGFSSSNFVFPPQKLPSLNNFNQVNFHQGESVSNSQMTRPVVMNTYNNSDITETANLVPYLYNLPDQSGKTTSSDNAITPVTVKEEENNHLNFSGGFHKPSASVNSNIPYSAASSPAFSHTPRQGSSSRPILRVKIPEDSDTTVPFKLKKDEENSNKKGSDVSGQTQRPGSTGNLPESKDKDSSNSPNNNLNPSVNGHGSDGNTNKSTPISATLPSAMFQFNLPNISSASNTKAQQPSLMTSNLPPATGGLLSSSIRPFLFNTGNGEQTPVSGLPSKYMNEFFPSPSNYYGDWNVSSTGAGETPLRTTAGLTLPLPSLSGSNGNSKGSDSSLGKHSLNNPNGSIKDELPSPIVVPTGGLPFGRFSKDKDIMKKDSK